MPVTAIPPKQVLGVHGGDTGRKTVHGHVSEQSSFDYDDGVRRAVLIGGNKPQTDSS